MFNKYLLGVCGALILICCIFYTMWDKTKSELNLIKAEKITLEQELKRRDENEKNLSKRISELNRIYNSHPDYSSTPVPTSILEFLHKSCKACK
jgi:hypothetical protein